MCNDRSLFVFALLILQGVSEWTTKPSGTKASMLLCSSSNALLLVGELFGYCVMVILQPLVGLFKALFLLRRKIASNLYCAILNGVKQDYTWAVLKLSKPCCLQTRSAGGT